MSPSPRFWTDRLGRAFALDLRSLAALRFALGLLLLWDTLSRLGGLGAFYTDAGVLPRALLVQTVSGWRWSLHLANGEAWFQLMLLLAQAGAALALAFGWRTRSMTLLAWLLSVSLMNRNPLVLGAGDTLLCALLFWSLFLPTAARWSIDAALSPQAPPADHRHASWASAALLLQLLSVFVFQALMQADAGRLYAADAGTLAAGRWLREHIGVNQAVATWTLCVQLIAPLLLLLQGGDTRAAQLRIVIRAILLLQLLLVAVLTMLTLSTGLLPWVQVAGLLALVGSAFWERRAQSIRRRQSGSGELRIYYDRDCRFCLKTCRLLVQMLVLPQARLLPAQDNRRADSLLRANDSWVVIDHDDTAHLKGAALLLLIRRSPLLAWAGAVALRLRLNGIADRAYESVARHRPAWARATARLLPERAVGFVPSVGVQRLAGLLATLVLTWNLASLRPEQGPFERLLAPPLELLRLDQHWNGYAPSPVPTDSWWVAAGHVADGREVDALREAVALRLDTPLAADDEGARWRAWRRQMAQPGSAQLRASWGEYLCRSWNASRSADSADRLVEFKLINVIGLQSGHGQQLEQRVLGRQDCAADAAR